MGESESRGRTTLRDIFAVMRATELSADEKVLWALYRSYDGGDGAWPGDDVLAEHMNKAVRTVQAHRSRLMATGYLERELRGPKPAIFRAVVSDERGAESRTPRGAESRTPGAKASQKGVQDSAGLPSYSPIRDEYGNTEEPTTDLGRAVVRFCQRVNTPWSLKSKSADAWAENLRDKYPHISIAKEIDRAGDWWEEALANGKKKGLTSPASALNNWLGRAMPNRPSSGSPAYSRAPRDER